MTNRTKYLFEETYLNMAADFGYTAHGPGEGEDLSYEATNSEAFVSFTNDNLVTNAGTFAGVVPGMDNVPHSSESAFLLDYEINMPSFGLPQTSIHHYHSPLGSSYGDSSSSASASVGPASPVDADSSISPPVPSLQDHKNNPSAAFFHMQQGSSLKEHQRSSGSSSDLTSRSFDGLFTSASPTGSKKESLLEMLHGPGYLSSLFQGMSGEEASNTSSSGTSTWVAAEASIGDFDIDSLDVDNLLASLPPEWLQSDRDVRSLTNMGLDPCPSSRKVVNAYTAQESKTKIPHDGISKVEASLAFASSQENHPTYATRMDAPVAASAEVPITVGITQHGIEEKGKRKVASSISKATKVTKQMKRAGPAIRNRPFNNNRAAPTSKFVCRYPGCGQRLRCPKGLDRHELRHTRNDNYGWFCPGAALVWGDHEKACTCPMLGYTRSDRLVAHIKKRGPGNPCYEAAIRLKWNPHLKGSVNRFKNYRPA
ncbi:hypothetical protein ACEPAI_6661 [Sanghuangporus weigelae]